MLVTYGRINPIIATLATLSAFRGLAFIISRRQIDRRHPAEFQLDRILAHPGYSGAHHTSLPWSRFIFILFMRHSRPARHIRAIGGNIEAALFAGINITRYRFGMYIFSGLMCGLTAIILTARAHSGQPAAATGLELDAITAAFLGGCGLRGGSGSILGTLLGVVIIGTLSNGLILMQVPTFYQMLAKGILARRRGHDSGVPPRRAEADLLSGTLARGQRPRS